MTTYTTWDGAELAYRVLGDGAPLVVVPGGPARNVEYLEDLGGLADVAGRSLVIPDLRGTGASPMPADPTAARADNLARDVDALRAHLGLSSIDLLGHSAGGTVAEMYAAQFPERVSRLVLVTPGTRAVDLDVTDEEWEAALAVRAKEPWFAAAKVAIDSDEETADARWAMSPFFYGRWDERSRAHAVRDEDQRNRAAMAAFHDGAYDPMRTLGALARLDVPVRILAGELDLMPTVALAERLAAIFRDGRVVVQAGAGHFPWVDDGPEFARLVAGMLTD
jgi:pimeloyl-ACP methyl ester carboxylesterase